jgi:hypothetical protein
MKTLTTILLLLSFASFLNASDDLAWVDKQIEAIKPPRKGISNKDIALIKDPFIYLEVKKDKKNKVEKIVTKPSKVLYHRSYRHRRVHSSYRFALKAILNKSVLINGRWYKEGGHIAGYTIKKVTFKSVLLTRGRREIILTTETKHKNIKINDK